MGNKESSSSKMMEEDQIAENDVSKDSVKFLLIEVQEVFWAEKHFAKLFPKMRKAAVGTMLQDALAGYLDKIESQLERLEQVFKILGEAPRAKRSELMAALAQEAKEVIGHKKKESDMRDVRIIAAAQKMQQHKVASYSSLIQLAGTMGNEDVISVLEEALSVEKQAVELMNNFNGGSTDPARETASDKTSQKDPEEPAATVYDSINLTGKHVKK